MASPPVLLHPLRYNIPSLTGANYIRSSPAPRSLTSHHRAADVVYVHPSNQFLLATRSVGRTPLPRNPIDLRAGGLDLGDGGAEPVSCIAAHSVNNRKKPQQPQPSTYLCVSDCK